MILKFVSKDNEIDYWINEIFPIYKQKAIVAAYRFTYF